MSTVDVDEFRRLLTAADKRIWALQAENEALRQRVKEYQKALLQLGAEVGGLRAFELEIRAVIGNTNFNCLMRRESEAAALASAPSSTTTEPPCTDP